MKKQQKGVEARFPSFDSSFLPCTSESFKEQETRRDSVVTKTIGKQWMPEEEHGNTTRGTIVIRWQEDETCRSSQQVHGWTEEYCRYLGYFTTIDISYTAPWHQRHRYESNITLVCNDENRQGGPMKARQDFKPTTKILASLRQEKGRQHSFIPKNERMRQRPFDEALRAELEWMSQNGRTYFSQPSSCSSSSENWWQHEHQDSPWREHQDTQWRNHQW